MGACRHLQNRHDRESLPHWCVCEACVTSPGNPRSPCSRRAAQTPSKCEVFADRLGRPDVLQETPKVTAAFFMDAWRSIWVDGTAEMRYFLWWPRVAPFPLRWSACPNPASGGILVVRPLKRDHSNAAKVDRCSWVIAGQAGPAGGQRAGRGQERQ